MTTALVIPLEASANSVINPVVVKTHKKQAFGVHAIPSGFVCVTLICFFLIDQRDLNIVIQVHLVS